MKEIGEECFRQMTGLDEGEKRYASFDMWKELGYLPEYTEAKHGQTGEMKTWYDREKAIRFCIQRKRDNRGEVRRWTVKHLAKKCGVKYQTVLLWRKQGYGPKPGPNRRNITYDGHEASTFSVMYRYRLWINQSFGRRWKWRRPDWVY